MERAETADPLVPGIYRAVPLWRVPVNDLNNQRVHLSPSRVKIRDNPVSNDPGGRRLIEIVDGTLKGLNFVPQMPQDATVACGA